MPVRHSLIAAFTVCTVMLSPIAPVSSHPHDALRTEQMAHVEHQILHMREALQAAIAAKDVPRLRALYAPSFVHTHGSGKVDGRDARIVSVLAGDPVIETAKVEELSIRIMHADTAIVTGRSPVLNKAENRDYDFRWMQVWVRVGGDWQLAASQATRLPAGS